MVSVAHSNIPEIVTPPTPHHVDRALKRSASTASLLSPPASVRKPRASKRLRIERDSDDESDHGDHLRRTNKAANRPKTRSMKVKAKAVAVAVPAPVAAPVVRKRLEFAEPHTEQDQDQDDEDASGAGPRPRTPVRVCVPAPVVAPQTPPRTVTRKGGRINRDGPLRDSPNNPFLMECAAPPALRPRPKRSAADFTEGPTVGYVFRGVPTTFANPYADQRPPSPTTDRDHPSFLPLEHPDFSPSELTRPKLLFPQAHGYAVDGDGSPRAREPPSTPKRGKAKAPRTPTRRSKRKAAEDADQEPIAGPSSKRVEIESVPKTPEPQTPGPKTPQRRGRTRTTVVTTTTVTTTTIPASSGPAMMTRSKKTVEARK